MKKCLIILLMLAVLVPSVLAKNPFSEVISEAFESGIISGNENGDFEAEKSATRAEFAVMLTRFLNLRGGINVFSDVPDGAWYEEALNATSYHGLLVGYDGKAMPERLVTLEDALTIIGRYYNAESEGDVPQNTAGYAKRFYAYASDNGLFVDGINPEPKHYAKKGEILALLYGYDRSIETDVRFITGYPRISADSRYGSISIDVRTNKPSTIYYGLSENGKTGYTKEEKLCKIEYGSEIVTANISVDADKVYDIYLRAVSENGTVGRFAVIEKAQPFSINAGKGTKEKPYIIRTQRELMQIALNPSSHYRLGADIEIDGEWEPIDTLFGSLDGNGFKISGIVIEDNSEKAGLFRTISGGTVKNLTVDASIIVKHTAGVIAGENDGGTIEGCVVTGEIRVKTNNVGGICGINRGMIKNSLSAMYSVSATSFAGGIAGQNFGNIIECISATESVLSDMSAGGIAGGNSGGITACVSACMTVYDTMTQNSGRIATNKNNGTTKNNYCYANTVTNATYIEETNFSQNGYDVSWEELEDINFYEQKLGFRSADWSMAKNGFRLPLPENAKEPALEAGRTAYLPKGIGTPEELRAIDKNEAGHYILKQDITLKTPWKTICARDGFSGTFNGNGYTIYNLKLKSEAGMFSNITGGTIRNLTIREATSEPGMGGAILTACNYGYIRNCDIYGEISSKKTGFIGTVAGENYGEISNCDVRVNVTDVYNNVTVGGICAENSGIVIGCGYWGSIKTTGENVTVGGICGYNNGGYVYESYARADIQTKGASAYIGGITGISLDAQIYKCSSAGSLKTELESTVYSGGVCGMTEGGIIYNCYSTVKDYIVAESGFAGGVAGLNSSGIVQNTYSVSDVIAVGKISAGGICGFSENGFIMQNVALNPAINTGGAVGAVIGSFDNSEISDNFSCDKLLINNKRITENENNGKVRSLDVLKNTDYYFKAVSDGGSLGWGNKKTGEDVWTTDNVYKLPILSGVKGQDALVMPVYK